MNICKNMNNDGYCKIGASSPGWCSLPCSYFESKHHNLKIFTDNVEQEALNQIDTLLSQDAFKDCKVRIMPDVHAGAGCVIGFTADLGKKVIPNIVGVDIGCGVLVVELGKIDIDFAKLDDVIRQYVPSGRNVHESVIQPFEKKDI